MEMGVLGKLAIITGGSSVEDFFANDMSDPLLQGLIDPRLHGRAVVQLMTNPAQNGTAQRGDGGAVRSIA